MFTFHNSLQWSHLLLPLLSDLVDGFLLCALRHGGHGFNGLHLSFRIIQLDLNTAQLGVGLLQYSSLPFELLWKGFGKQAQRCVWMDSFFYERSTRFLSLSFLRCQASCDLQRPPYIWHILYNYVKHNFHLCAFMIGSHEMDVPDVNRSWLVHLYNTFKMIVRNYKVCWTVCLSFSTLYLWPFTHLLHVSHFC